MPRGNSLRQIQAIDVYLERRKTREAVGRLSRARNKGKPNFEFEYNSTYILKRNSIPLGPEFPLTRMRFTSKRLFPTFEDRMPSRENPAYAEYCQHEGISPDETDPIVLLATIGRRGPSSFVFEPVESPSLTSADIAAYRNELNLTVRQFAAAFGLSPASVQKLERGIGSGKELIKRLEIYVRFPEVALYEVQRNRARLHFTKYQQVIEKIRHWRRITFTTHQ